MYRPPRQAHAASPDSTKQAIREVRDQLASRQVQSEEMKHLGLHEVLRKTSDSMQVLRIGIQSIRKSLFRDTGSFGGNGAENGQQFSGLTEEYCVSKELHAISKILQKAMSDTDPIKSRVENLHEICGRFGSKTAPDLLLTPVPDDDAQSSHLPQVRILGHDVCLCTELCDVAHACSFLVHTKTQAL